MRQIVIIGLDGASPELVFDRWQNELPNLRAIMKDGAYGRLESTVPAITPQAWTALLSGKNPGKIGFWDFTYRRDFSYQETEIVSAAKIKCETLYHLLPRAGFRIGLINVPVTYPPIPVKNGFCLSSFLTPSPRHLYAYPPALKTEIEAKYGEYILDASRDGVNFRQLDKREVLDRIYRMDRQKFDILADKIKERKYDFLFMVAMGTDRMPHLFYKYFDPTHPLYEDNPAFRDALLDHYRFCDREIGRIRQLLGPETVLMVVSDHGVQKLSGRVNINEWLAREGYLALAGRPAEIIPLKDAAVDWPRTKAWAAGFMEARIYLNVRGRENAGAVAPADYDRMLDELSKRFMTIKDPAGRPLKVEAIKRTSIYSGPYAKYAPDLFVRMNGYEWAANPLLGYDTLYSYQTPKGDDDGVHSPFGIFAITGNSGIKSAAPLLNIRLLDIAPTILDLFGLPVPDDMDGKVIRA